MFIIDLIPYRINSYVQRVRQIVFLSFSLCSGSPMVAGRHDSDRAAR